MFSIQLSFQIQALFIFFLPCTTKQAHTVNSRIRTAGCHWFCVGCFQALVLTTPLVYGSPSPPQQNRTSIAANSRLHGGTSQDHWFPMRSIRSHITPRVIPAHVRLVHLLCLHFFGPSELVFVCEGVNHPCSSFLGSIFVLFFPSCYTESLVSIVLFTILNHQTNDLIGECSPGALDLLAPGQPP